MGKVVSAAAAASLEPAPGAGAAGSVLVARGSSLCPSPAGSPPSPTTSSGTMGLLLGIAALVLPLVPFLAATAVSFFLGFTTPLFFTGTTLPAPVSGLTISEDKFLHDQQAVLCHDAGQPNDFVLTVCIC